MEKFIEDGLFDTQSLDELLGSFCDATGLHTEAVDNSGNTFFVPRNLERCEFCKIIRKNPRGEQKCREIYRQASLEAAKWEEPYFFRCHAGLVIWAVPIIINNTSVGCIICGQVLLWKPDRFFWKELEALHAGNPDLTNLKQAANKLEVISAERTQSAANLLFVVVSHIVKRKIRVMEEIEASKRFQQQIRKEIEERKKFPEKRQDYEAYLKKERKLLRYIRLGDRARANNTLRSLLADLITRSHGRTEEIKFRISELASLVSRAAVEGGADAERAMAALQQYFKEIDNLERLEEIFYQAYRIVEDFLRDIFALADKKHLSLVKRARDFILENYDRPLKIEEIAAHLFISPSHLSRLFRQELDCTVLEYLTRVRVEEAVELLKRPEYSIEQVTKMTGFQDQSYFTKVFKKYIGVTPLVYRNSF